MNNLTVACFLSLYSMRDYAAAAEALSVTQQTLMRNIQRLESELGSPLFLRDARGATPTLAGQRYYEFFRSKGRELSAASRVMRGEGLQTGLRIGWCEWTECPGWISAAIKEFKGENPAAAVSVSQASGKLLKELHTSGEIDLAIAPREVTGSLGARYLSSRLCDVPLYILVSKNHPSAEAGEATAELLRLCHLTAALGDEDEEQIKRRIYEGYALLEEAAPEIRVLPNWSSVYINVNMRNGLTFAPANNTACLHDRFALLPTKLQATLMTARSADGSNPIARSFQEHLISCRERKFK